MILFTMLGLIGYYIVSRLVLIAGTVFLYDIDVTRSNGWDDMPWGLIFCIPIIGDFWVLAGPFLLLATFFEWFANMIVGINNSRRAKAETKRKLSELRNLQLKVQEAELDKELSQVKSKYNDRNSI